MGDGILRSNRSFVGSAVEVMSEALGGYIETYLEDRIASEDWTRLLAAHDANNGRPAHPIKKTDLAAQLRIVTTPFGSRGHLFDLSRPQQRLVGELRDIRNAWAHGGDFDAADLLRALDTCLRLLKSFELSDAADEIMGLIHETRASTVQAGDYGRTGITDPISVPAPGTTTPAGSATPASPTTTQQDAAEAVVAIQEKASNISLAVSHSTSINYATVQARFPILDRVELDYTGVAPISVLVDASLTSDGATVSTIAERHMDLIPGKTSFHDFELELDPEVFSKIDSRRRGKLVVRVRNGDEVLAVSASPVDLLPGTHWSGAGTQADAELLAAFVQPQHPQISKILSDTSDLLLERTGDSALQGHQGGPQRVDAIVEAVFAVLSSREIRYSNPPASWELAHLGGQHVRSLEEVLNDRFGTCLDTSVLVAAVLEQIDINTTLWLVPGHAFIAYWRFEDRPLPSTSLDGEAAGTLFNMVNADILRIVETTAITNDKRATIEASSEGTKRKYAQGAEAAAALEFVIDVRQARLSGIFPLPTRSLGESGDVTVVEYRPATSQTMARFFKEKSARPIAAPTGTGDVVPPRVVQWKNGLLDLSLRNRLLNFTPGARFPLAIPDNAIAGCEDLINDGKAIELLPEDAIGAVDLERYKTGALLPVDRRVDLLLSKGQAFTQVNANGYKTKLRKIAADAKTIADQSGANNLYLAMGSLLWNSDGKKELRSPLILIPVSLQPAGRGGHFRVVRDESGTSTPNYCLAEKLREQFNLSIPAFENPEQDSSGIDLEKTFAAVTRAIMDAGLPFHVEPTVDLAILQFAKFRMWKDLDENWETFLKAPLVKHLVETPTSEFVDPVTADALELSTDLDDLASRLPVAADASQLEAVASAERGRTFVLEGPPGTGKSQTITNLLAHAMSSGKRVLFVAEKRAALEVVSKRLNDVGLGAYALDLHDKGSRPNVVRKQIKDSIDHLVFSDDQGMQLVKSDLRAARRKLAFYASQVHDENAAGYSAYSANNSILVVDDDIPALPVTERFASETDTAVISAVRDAMSELPETAEFAHPQKHHPWGFIDAPVDAESQTAVLQANEVLGFALRNAQYLQGNEFAGKLLSSATEPRQLRLSAHLIGAQTPVAILDEVCSEGWNRRLDALQTGAANLVEAMAWIPATVDPSVLLVDHTVARDAAVEVESSGFLGLGRNKRRLQVVAEHFGEAWRGSEEDVKNLVSIVGGLLEARAKCAELVAGLNEVAGIELHAAWNPFNVHDLESIAVRRAELTELTSTLPRGASEEISATQLDALRDVLVEPLQEAHHVATELSAIATAWEGLNALLPGNANGTQAWAGDQGFLDRFAATRAEREVAGVALRGLGRWVAFILALEILREHELFGARDALLLGDYPAEDALRGFMRGTAEAALRERLGASALDDFSESAHLRNISRFTTASKDIRGHLVSALPAQISERRAPLLRKADIRMGELQRQLNRRSGGQTVRQLMTNYGDLITTIMPCVLVSPDSASRFFPPHAGQFDVVVFDEASQISVADAVGTLGRANSAVVVGDSKQMPPTAFGGSTFDTESVDDEVPMIADEESILSECVQARVPRQWLSWHYRSQDESLIAFSNQQYYEGKLSSFPAPRNGQSGAGKSGYGISLVRVDGKFHRSGAGVLLRTNPIEAEAIVAEVKRRFDKSPGENPSIGVVTFNVQQRNYIEGLLRDLADDRLTEALDTDGEGLFVKNLENVQGDERDVILFSTAFSVNDAGKLPLNFGPLNNSGGERRLNVAVTRARRQVIVFSSFNPEDLRAENSTSIGIKHLRAYLDLAAQGTRILNDGSHRALAEDRYRDQIAGQLRDQDHFVETNVGLSEFKIDLTLSTKERPEEPLVAVLLDNEPWAERKTVGDRDGLPEEVLRNLLGWQSVVRIWLPAWLQDSAAVLERIDQEVQRADKERTAAELQREQQAEAESQLHESGIESEAGAAEEADLREPRRIDAEPVEPSIDIDPAGSIVVTDPGTLPEEHIQLGSGGFRSNTAVVEVDDLAPAIVAKARPHSAWNQRNVGTLDELDELETRRARMKASELLSEIAAAEWPLPVKRLSKLANGSYGLSKVLAAREQAMVDCLDRSTYVVDNDGFVWPMSIEQSEWMDCRTGFADNGLAMTEISPREVSNAMCELVAKKAGLDSDGLKRETMAFFGYKRFTTGISTWLQQGLELAVREGRLRTANGQILPG